MADIIGPPLAGFVADKIGNFRFFSSFYMHIIIKTGLIKGFYVLDDCCEWCFLPFIVIDSSQAKRLS